jgi:beta-phosphoglucomutase-like phosphatase (HAD superfamily)
MALATKLDALAVHWQLALDGALAALEAAGRTLPPLERADRVHALARERAATSRALGASARAVGSRVDPWVAPMPVRASLLGLPPETRACVFDLDGVLTNSALLQATAWAEVLDDFLMRVAQVSERQFIPFDPVDDYRRYLDGRPRLDGIHAFLTSRGLRIPEGRLDDPCDTDSAHGLARRKHEALERVVHGRGVAPADGARRFLEAAARARLARAVVSESASTHELVELAGLGPVVDAEVDAACLRAEELRPRPAPDLVLSACHRLRQPAELTVVFTHTPAGLAAGASAGARVVGVATGEEAEMLRGFGAECVVASLAALLDPRLR